MVLTCEEAVEALKRMEEAGRLAQLAWALRQVKETAEGALGLTKGATDDA